MSRTLNVGAAAAFTLLLAAGTAAQGSRSTSPAAQAAVRTAAQAAAPLPAGAGGDAYSYRAEGRRDPFVSLVDRGHDKDKGKLPPEGLRGLYASDVVLKGILQSRGSFLAIVQGPDSKRPFIVHANERLADGVVKTITADGMLILQEVNDPLSLTMQREIRKTLRVVEEVK